MSHQQRNIWSNVKAWHSLTEIPPKEGPHTIGKSQNPPAADSAPPAVRPVPAGLSPALIRLLCDSIAYPFGTVSMRIKRLGMSARLFEQAKREGLEKGLIIESSAGQMLYLIPTKKTYEVLSIDCPSEQVPDEHYFDAREKCMRTERANDHDASHQYQISFQFWTIIVVRLTKTKRKCH